jgi:hypothetical protein
MGNKLFKQRQQSASLTMPSNIKEQDTLSIISDLEPVSACETASACVAACETASACASVCASACATVMVPIIDTSDLAESLSKSLPIDIPIPEPVIEQKSEIIESICDTNICGTNICGTNICGTNICGTNICDTNICDTNICDTNNSAEIESLSSISEECGFNSEPITEESDLESEQDVLELDE